MLCLAALKLIVLIIYNAGGFNRLYNNKHVHYRFFKAAVLSSVSLGRSEVEVHSTKH